MPRPLIQLNHLCVLDCSGADVETFLQGQLTCDVNKITSDAATFAAHCNPQGRVRFIGFLIKSEDHFYLILPHSIADQALSDLKKYAAFSKTKIEKNASINLYGIVDKDTDIPETNCASLPDERKIIYITTSQESFLKEKLDSYLQGNDDRNRDEQSINNGTALWHYYDIVSGFPQVYPDTYETFVAQRLNLQCVGGISFKKGCYIGQEIIARIHFLGQLKHHMFLGKTTPEKTLNAGDGLYDENDSSIATVVDAAVFEDTQYVLFVMQDKELQNAIYTKEKQIVLLQPLPYELEESR
ncbi:MAG: YgfZ/GcvT domain-containing protein [Gammaproteobacteria bacterium]